MTPLNDPLPPNHPESLEPAADAVRQGFQYYDIDLSRLKTKQQKQPNVEVNPTMVPAQQLNHVTSRSKINDTKEVYYPTVSHGIV
jgi:hypothetical protein